MYVFKEKSLLTARNKDFIHSFKTSKSLHECVKTKKSISPLYIIGVTQVMSLGIFLHIVEDYRCCREVDDFSGGEVVQIGATVSASVPIALLQSRKQTVKSPHNIYISLIYIQIVLI